VRAAAWWALSVVLLLVAVALGGLAFTRFSGEPGPAPGAPGFGEYEAARIREAWWSVGLGVAAAFTLLGAFACFNRASPPAVDSAVAGGSEGSSGQSRR
jgi:nitric oxide reductase large subunit